MRKDIGRRPHTDPQTEGLKEDLEPTICKLVAGIMATTLAATCNAR